MRLVGVAFLVGVLLLLGVGPASADQVTNVFSGVVVATDIFGNPATTLDLGHFFGGQNLVGDTFTLAMTLDTSLVDPGSPSFITGGAFYFSPNPITTTLTIAGYTAGTSGIDASSFAVYGDLGGTIEAYLQGFNWINQVQSPGVYVDLTTLVNASPDLTTPLPAMLLSNNDFSNNGAAFYDTACGEFLNLDIEAVNTPVATPEPSSLLLLGSGLAIAGLRLRGRKARNSSVAA